jgi:hypothetical protein
LSSHDSILPAAASAGEVWPQLKRQPLASPAWAQYASFSVSSKRHSLLVALSICLSGTPRYDPDDERVALTCAQDELTLRIAAYAGTSAISGVIGGLVSYAFGFASQNVLKQWQWLFIAEGIPTIIVGVLTPFILPDRPEQVKPRWMSDKEHAIALDRRNRYVKNASDEGINWNHVRA